MGEIMEKNAILFVGEHPFGFTGNSLMMLSILEKLDQTVFDPTVFCPCDVHTYNPPTTFLPLNILSSGSEKDVWGTKKLINVLTNSNVSALVFVGIDFWRYAAVFDEINDLRRKKHFRWIGIVPYDLPNIRQDWITYLGFFDHVAVYSKFGYSILNGKLKNLSFFRPPMTNIDKFVPMSKKERLEIRHRIFPTIKDDAVLFGFIARNQIRKDPQTLLLAFRQLVNIRKNVHLYFHVNLDEGVYNLKQYIEDLDFPDGVLFVREPKSFLSFDMMPKVYSSFDFYLNISYQEGLSWTVIQSLLCGTPTIISKTTAHNDYNSLPGVKYIVPDQTKFLPIMTKKGQSWVQTKGCSEASIVESMVMAVDNVKQFRTERETIAYKTKEFYQPDNITTFLSNIIKKKKRTDAFVFAQHSSAGDVLMTTRSFKALRERHPDKKMIYMTQSKYFDLLKNNPYIDELIDWSESVFQDFELCYNPHGERILKGEFRSLDVKLSDMYHLLLGVQPSDFFIQEEKPEYELPKNFVVIHSSGQDKFYRTYKEMDSVVQRIPYPTVQIGSNDDMFCPSVSLDLRGKLNFNQTAYVMKRAKVAIVIDSFPSHLAGAVGTPVVVIYGPGPARVTGPVGNPNKIINLEADKLKYCERMTNCWGYFRGCKEPCINKIHPDRVFEAFCSLIRNQS